MDKKAMYKISCGLFVVTDNKGTLLTSSYNNAIIR